MKNLTPSANVLDCFGTEYAVFGQYVQCLQESSLFCNNTNCHMKDNAVDWNVNFFVKKDINNNLNYSFSNEKCNFCENPLSIRFIHNPPWILVE